MGEHTCILFYRYVALGGSSLSRIQFITEIGFVAALLRPQTEIEKDEIAPGASLATADQRTN